jgi:nitroreductase
MSTSVIKAIIDRRSIRSFKSDTIPRQDIELLLKSMEAAPSAGNIQPWSFYVISNQEIKEKLTAISFNQTALSQAPLAFAICAKPQASAETYQELGANFFCVQDTACVAQNLQLAAHSLGYGTVWIGIVQKDEVRSAINAPADEDPVALIALGVPDEQPGEYQRVEWKEITTFID